MAQIGGKTRDIQTVRPAPVTNSRRKKEEKGVRKPTLRPAIKTPR